MPHWQTIAARQVVACWRSLAAPVEKSPETNFLGDAAAMVTAIMSSISLRRRLKTSFWQLHGRAERFARAG